MDSNFYPKAGSVIKSRYIVKDVIATGGTAIVLECTDRVHDKKVAVKRFYADKLTTKLRSKVFAEAELNIKSDYCVIAERAFDYTGFLHLAMPYAEGKSLRDILETENSINISRAVYISLCITKAASDLHAARILSTDIKPENSIVSSESIARLIDFSCFESVGNKAEVSLGTVPYAAPELIRQEKLSEAIDIYSIGMVFYEMLAGMTVFSKQSADFDLYTRRGLKFDIYSPIKSCYPEAASIISRAIEPKPERRWNSADELFAKLISYYDSLSGNPKSPKVFLLLNNGRKIYLSSGKSVLGRSDIEIQNYFISSRHFEIDVANGDAYIRDMGSRNGTSLNRQRVGGEWVKLQNTDTIEIADTKVIVGVEK